ncbi:hypothetical protein D3C87_1997430 [compost metagenome]
MGGVDPVAVTQGHPLGTEGVIFDQQGNLPLEEVVVELIRHVEAATVDPPQALEGVLVMAGASLASCKAEVFPAIVEAEIPQD